MDEEIKLLDHMKKVSIQKSKNILLCITFIVFFFIFDLLIGEVLNYYDHFDIPDMHSLMWNDLYKTDPNSIDVMFMGSSHARFAFDTRIFDNKLKVKSFNLSSSEQTPLIGYFSLKEALKYQKPKLLVYEAYWREFGMDDNTTSAYFAYDYMRGFDTKTELLANMYDNKNFPSFLVQAFCRTYKYRDSFVPAVKNVLEGRIIKPSTASKEIKYSNFKYYENGSFGSDEIVSNEKLFKTNPFQKAALYFKWDKTQIEYFKKTMKLCSDNNIKMLVITTPLPKPSMDYVKKYEEYSSKILSITNDYGLQYIDYNITNKKYGNFRNEFFFDSNHLNLKGTEFLDNTLIPIIKKYLD
jgi:hypothetical protein